MHRPLLLRHDLDQHGIVDQRGQCVLLRHGAQTITGAGSWTGTGTFYIDSGSSTSLANDVTMAFSQYQVYGTFSLDDHILTLNPATTLSFTNYGTFAMGSQTLAFDAPGGATFTNYGTTSGSGTFQTSGTVSLVCRRHLSTRRWRSSPARPPPMARSKARSPCRPARRSRCQTVTVSPPTAT